MKELHERFFDLRLKKDQLNQQLKEVQLELDQLESDLVLSMENEGLTQIKSDRGTLYLRDEVYARIEDPNQAFAWLRDNEMGDMIKETVNAKSLSSLVKEKGEIPGVISHFVTKVGRRTNYTGDPHD